MRRGEAREEVSAEARSEGWKGAGLEIEKGIGKGLRLKERGVVARENGRGIGCEDKRICGEARLSCKGRRKQGEKLGGLLSRKSKSVS